MCVPHVAKSWIQTNDREGESHMTKCHTCGPIGYLNMRREDRVWGKASMRLQIMKVSGCAQLHLFGRMRRFTWIVLAFSWALKTRSSPSGNGKEKISSNM